MKNAKFITKFFQNLLLVILSIVVFLMIIEVTACCLLRFRVVKKHTAMETQLIAGTEDWRKAHMTADSYREPDPVLFWRPVPWYPYNSQRFKGPKAVIPKPSRVYRIICYGDSNTDGPAHGSWPEHLQQILNEQANNEKWNYEVLNAGVGGYSSYQGLLRFQEEVAVYEPDLILVSFGWNDPPLTVDFPDKKYRPPHSIVVFGERIFLKFNFYLVAKYYFNKSLKIPADNSNPRSRVSLEDYLLNLASFLKTAKAHKVSAVFLTRPHKLKVKEMKALPSWRKKVPLYNEALLEFAKNNNALSIDIENIFEDNYSYLFADECHFTLEGHKKMAEVIYRKLLEANYMTAKIINTYQYGNGYKALQDSGS